MFFLDLIIALLVSIFLTPIFVYGFRRRGPWPGFMVFFQLIFLAAWAGGIWLTPVGPSLLGVYWLSFLSTGLVFALLLAAASPPPERSTIVLKTREEAKKDRRIISTISTFYWVLIGVLAFAIIAGYWIVPEAGPIELGQ